MYKTIKLRFISKIVIVITLILALFGYYNFLNEKNRLVEELKRDNQNTLIRLQNNLPIHMWNFDDKAVSINLKSELIEPHVAAIKVSSTDGAVTFLGKPYYQEPNTTIVKTLTDPPSTELTKISAPIQYDNFGQPVVLGELSLFYDPNLANDKIFHVLFQQTFMLVILDLIIAVLIIVSESQLLEAKEKAEAASKAKANFLATMSHEIRTPMNGVIGMIDLLMTSPLNSDQKSMTSTIRDSAFSLLSIINDILDFSKIEAGKLSLEKIEFTPISLFEGVMDTLVPTAETNNIHLNLYIDPMIPQKVQGDPVRLRQVLFNLVGNAIKFSKSKERQGLVCVSIHHKETLTDSILLEISIQDNGIGIAKDKQEALFQPFTQAESSTTRKFGGTGLGLAISQNLIHLMGGTISVESEEGEGADFKIELELKVTDHHYIDFNNSSHTVKFINLIQDPKKQAIITSYINAFKTQKIEASSLSEIKQTANIVEPTIVVYDQKQPINHILANEGLPENIINQLKMIYLNRDQKEIEHYSPTHLALGASPIKITNFVYAFRVLMGLESPINLNYEESIDEINNEHLKDELILVAEDNPVNQDVVRRQLQKLGYQCHIANDGIEAEMLYRQHIFSLVLLDCHMPNRDGYTTAPILRAIQKNEDREVPIIAFTANALVGEADKCLEVGMDDHLPKPAELLKLKAMLAKWLPNSHAHATANSAPLQPVDPPPVAEELITTPSENITGKQESDSYLDNSVITNYFLDDKEEYLYALSDYIELVLPEMKILAEYKNGDYDKEEAMQLAHKLKSSSRTVGAMQLGDFCEAIEKGSNLDNEGLIDIFIQLSLELEQKEESILLTAEQIKAELNETS